MKKYYTLHFFKSFIMFGCLLITSLPGVYAQDSPGDMYLYPAATRVRENENFDLYIMVNSGTQKIAAYGITISYNTNIMHVSDVIAGPDGYVSASGAGITQGAVRLSGFDATGKGPGEALHFLTLRCEAVSAGTTGVNISINQLVDPEIMEVGTPTGIGGSVTVSARIPGDVNADSFIDIIDALLIAQYYVGQYPEGFVTVNGDVNDDGSVDIVDALLVARYYVGLEEVLPVSTPVPTAVPGDTPTPIPTFDAGIPLVGSVLTGVGSRDDWRESVIAGDYLYIVSKRDMKVFNISIPFAPSFIQDISFLSGYYYRTVAYGNYLYSYYRYSSDTVYIWDLSEPQHPVRVKNINLFGNTRGMVFAGTYAFVIHGNYLSTVDMADPLNPVTVHDFDLGGYSTKITRTGDYVYITTGNETAGLQVINISNPLEPFLAGSLAVDIMSMFHISGDYAYGTSDDMLYIINIADPENMFITGQLPREYRTATLHAADNFIYITYHPEDPMTSFDCINAINPTQPFVQSSMPVPYWNYSLAVKEHYLYYTCNTTTYDACCVYIIDIAQPGNPVHAGSIDGGGFTNSMAVQNKILYMADGLGGMKIVDVSDPSHTVYLSHVPIENTVRIAVSGDYAYCASGSNGLSIINISDPHQPEICSTLPTYHSAVDVKTDGRYVYAGDRPWGLTVIDPFPPDNPQVLYHAMPDGYPTPTPEEILPTPEPHANAWDTNMLSISGNTACLSVNLNPRIRIVDISDPRMPVATGFIHQTYPKDIALSGDYLYIPDIPGIPLLIYDIAEPGNPLVIGACPDIANFYSTKITLANTYAYLASGGAIAVIDVSDPVRPLYCGHIDHRSIYYSIEDIVVSDGYLYVASGANPECVAIYKLE